MADIATTQQNHQELFRLFLKDRKLDPDRVNQLLDEIVEQSAQVESVDEHLWLQEALEQWRTAGRILRIDLNRELRIPSTDHPLKPPSVFTVWLDKDLQRRLEFQANEFAQRRALRWHQELSVEQISQAYQQALPQQAREELK